MPNKALLTDETIATLRSTRQNASRLGRFMSELATQQKSDLHWSWNRSDEEFFSRGACHVLCAAFLQEHSDSGFHAAFILPSADFRGRHVVAATETTIFDWQGFSPREAFLNNYTDAYRKRNAGWEYHLVPLRDPLSYDFCARHNHRRRDQFLHDPLPRAQTYLRRLLESAVAPPAASRRWFP